MSLKYLLFDFDNTLYDPTIFKMERHMIDKVYQFSMQKLRIPYEEAYLLLEGYHKKYGCVAAGLASEKGIPIKDQIIDFDFSMLTPNPKLEKALKQVNIKKAIFSNGYDYYIKNALSAIGLTDCFNTFITATELGTTPKPQLKSYEIVCNRLNVKPSECLFFEDNPNNLKVAKEIGMYTVLCHNDKDRTYPFVDFYSDNLEDDMTEIVNELYSD